MSPFFVISRAPFSFSFGKEIAEEGRRKGCLSRERSCLFSIVQRSTCEFRRASKHTLQKHILFQAWFPNCTRTAKSMLKCDVRSNLDHLIWHKLPLWLVPCVAFVLRHHPGFFFNRVWFMTHVMSHDEPENEKPRSGTG